MVAAVQHLAPTEVHPKQETTQQTTHLNKIKVNQVAAKKAEAEADFSQQNTVWITSIIAAIMGGVRSTWWMMMRIRIGPLSTSIPQDAWAEVSTAPPPTGMLGNDVIHIVGKYFVPLFYYDHL